jgi:hypothetical protein
MLTAIVLICLASDASSAGECTPDRAAHRGIVPGLWMDLDDCESGALSYLHALDVSRFLEPDRDYVISVSCELVEGVLK